jgi:hypothetical protein
MSNGLGIDWWDLDDPRLCDLHAGGRLVRGRRSERRFAPSGRSRRVGRCSGPASSWRSRSRRWLDGYSTGEMAAERIADLEDRVARAGDGADARSRSWRSGWTFRAVADSAEQRVTSHESRVDSPREDTTNMVTREDIQSFIDRLNGGASAEESEPGSGSSARRKERSAWCSTPARSSSCGSASWSRRRTPSGPSCTSGLLELNARDLVHWIVRARGQPRGAHRHPRAREPRFHGIPGRATIRSCWRWRPTWATSPRTRKAIPDGHLRPSVDALQVQHQ